GRKADLVYAVVDGIVDFGIDGIDLRQQVLRRVVAFAGADAVECGIEHADDLRRLIADYRVALKVPQHGNGYASAIAGLCPQIDFVQILGLGDGIGHHAGAGLEGPAVFSHIGVDHRHADHLFQAFQGAQDQCAIGPGAGQGNVKMVAAGLGAKSTRTAGPGTAISGDPVAKLRIAAYETSTGAGCVVPLVLPFSVYE